MFKQQLFKSCIYTGPILYISTPVSILPCPNHAGSNASVHLPFPTTGNKSFSLKSLNNGFPSPFFLDCFCSNISIVSTCDTMLSEPTSTKSHHALIDQFFLMFSLPPSSSMAANSSAATWGSIPVNAKCVGRRMPKSELKR